MSDELLVQLFYAAQGSITQFRIKAREILADSGKESTGEAEELSLRALYDDACISANKNAKDAGILRTLIHRTHACDLKFTKTGGVSTLSATFKSNTVPGIGMSEGVRRYLDAFMQDAALANQKEG